MHALDDGLPVSRLVARYAGAGLVALIVVALATAWISRDVGTTEAIDEARRITTSTGAAAIEPIVDDGLLAQDPASIARVDSTVRRAVLHDPLVRVKIWNGTGTVLYSDEPRLIGQTYQLDEDDLRVLRDGVADAGVSDLSQPENRYEEPATKLLEVYSRIAAPDGTPLLFEAYFRYSGVADAGRRVWLRFAPWSLGALVLLAVLQLPLATSLARRLRRNQQQREDLLQSAIDATDAERRRIAADLHDGVVQDLAGVTFSLGAAARTAEGGGGDGAEIRQAADRVRDAIRSLRSLLVEIYPPNLYEEGLGAALSDLMARLDPRGIETSLVIDADVSRLDLEVVQLLYRAAQEALRNVVAHADAARVDVTVTDADGTVALEVSDDGRGLDTEQMAATDGHFGLKSLAGLAAAMGATLTVDSDPGRGTTVCLEVPRR